MKLVVDASVAAKWFFAEAFAVEARRLLLDASYELLAPELWLAELGNVLWLKVKRGDVDERSAAELVQVIAELPIQLHPLGPLMPEAVELSLRLNHPIYDCLYLALCRHEACRLVTADDRLRRVGTAGGLANSILWISDVP